MRNAPNLCDGYKSDVVKDNGDNGGGGCEKSY